MSASRSSRRLSQESPRLRSFQACGRVRVQLDEALGQCYYESLQLEQGLSIGRLHYHPLCTVIEDSSAPHEGHVLVVTVGLQGQSGFIGKDGCRVKFDAGHTTTTAFRAAAGERIYQAGATASQLRVIIEKQALCKYVGNDRAEQLLGSGRLQCLGSDPSSEAVRSHAAALVRYLQRGLIDPANRLGLHIHALSLLSEQLALLAPQAIPCLPPGARQVECLERARRLMCEHLHQPLTVAYLAAAVGLNERAFKEGFRCLFHRTPARMLLELRMGKAMTLLESGQQVAQVAWQVGYQYPNNFTTAFTRYFGRTPKSAVGRKR